MAETSRQLESTPFPSELKERERVFEDIFTLAEAKNKYIRRWPGNKAAFSRPERWFGEDDSSDEFLARYKNAMETAFGALRAEGVRIPHAELVIGRDEMGSKQIFSVTDRIEGEDITLMRELPPEAIQEVLHAFKAAMANMERAIEDGGMIWSDMRLAQFMYGKAPEDAEPHVYLVDFEPWISKTRTEDEYVWEQCLRNVIRDMKMDLQDMKKQCPSAEEPIDTLYNEIIRLEDRLNHAIDTA